MMSTTLCQPVLIVQTGGTIDKVYPQHQGAYGFEINKPAAESVLKRIAPNFIFEIKSFLTKDSQDITDKDREYLLQDIIREKQDLVLVTHGTDTMCETAHYFEAEMGESMKRIVITGALKPECMKDSDADFNIGFALGSLQSLSSPGVWVAMKGQLIPGAHVLRNETGDFIDDRRLFNESE